MVRPAKSAWLPQRLPDSEDDAWVQLKKEKWLSISRKRHQIGHLDFRSFRLLTNLKTVESAPLIPKKRRFSGPSLEPSWNQITANELPALPDAAVCQPLAVHC